jgi:hypothetical protein
MNFSILPYGIIYVTIFQAKRTVEPANLQEGFLKIANTAKNYRSSHSF